MTESTISLTDLKQNMGEIINRAAYGNERIIILSRGKPRAALINIQELERLELLAQEAQTDRNVQEQLDLLADMAALRAQMDTMTDSAEVLREVREERLNDLMGLS